MRTKSAGTYFWYPVAEENVPAEEVQPEEKEDDDDSFASKTRKGLEDLDDLDV